MKYCFTLNAVLSVAFFPLQSSIVIRPTFPLILSWCSDNCFIPVLAWKKNCHALINTLRTQTLTVKIGALTKAWHLLWPISPLLPSLNYGALSCTYKAYTTKPKTQLPPTRQTKHIIVQYNTAPPLKKINKVKRLLLDQVVHQCSSQEELQYTPILYKNCIWGIPYEQYHSFNIQIQIRILMINCKQKFGEELFHQRKILLCKNPLIGWRFLFPCCKRKINRCPAKARLINIEKRKLEYLEWSQEATVLR